MFYFHPIVAALLLCLFLPFIGIPLLVVMFIYYAFFANEEVGKDKDKENGR